jgi:hypothetical protein
MGRPGPERARCDDEVMVMDNETIKLLLEALVPLIGGVLVWLLKRQEQLIDTQTQDARKAAFLHRLNDVAEDVVGELQQTVVDALKREGEFGTEQAKQVLATARIKILASLSGEVDEGCELLRIDAEKLARMVETKVERMVAKLKAGKP